MSTDDRSDVSRSASRGASTLIIDLEALHHEDDETRGFGPYALSAEVPLPWLRETLGKTDAEVARPGRVAGDISLLSGGAVLIRGRLEAGFTVPCARCLEPAAVSADAEVCVQYERGAASSRPMTRADEDDEEGIDPDEPDQFTYAGTKIDLRPMLGETILMAYPMRALCERGEDCRGLCTNCGADLNEHSDESGICGKCGLGGMVGGIGRVASAGDAESAEGAENDAEDSPWKAALRKLRDD